MRPRPGVPSGLTADAAVALLLERNNEVRDFTGSATVAVTIDGSRETAGLSIRYLRPDDIRVIVKGPFGIEIAVISAVGDTATVYFPSENAFVRVSRDQAPLILRSMMPSVQIDMDRIESLFSLTLPPSDTLEFYEKRLIRQNNRAQLILTGHNGAMIYRYVLEGPEMRVVKESLTVIDETVWEKRVSSFGHDNGVTFPGQLEVRDHDRELSIDFSRYSINSGLTTDNIEFHVPASAERWIVEAQ